MLPRIRKYAMIRTPSEHLCGTVALALTFGALLLTALLGHAQQQNRQNGSMPGMDMSGMGDMGDMGPSMAAMAGHIYMTPLRPKQPGDEEKAKAVVANVKAAIERYKDYRKALVDGYVIAKPELKQPQYHFINQANTREADIHFDPSKPTALLYRRTPMQQYKLEGVMYTASPDATEDELNLRIPLSIARCIGTSTFVWPRKTVPRTTKLPIPSSACSARSTPKRPAKLKGAPSSRMCSPGCSTFSHTRTTSKRSSP